MVTDGAVSIRAVKRKGSFLDLVRDPVRFFREVSNHDGDLAEIRLGPRRFYVVKSPAVIHDLLVTQARLFEKFPPGNPRQKLFGEGLLTSEGARHQQQRRDLQPAFRRERLGHYATQMGERADQIAATWRTGETVDISEAMNRLTLGVICESFFGLTDEGRVGELGAQLHVMLGMVNQFVLPWGRVRMQLPLPSSRRYWRAQRRRDEIIAELIRAARAPDAPETLTALLLAVRQAEGEGLTEAAMRDEMVTMVVAGHETVAVGLAWCLYLLAAHPREQEALAGQTREALAGRRPEIEDYERLPFLQRAFSESLRLYPPIWILGRRALAEYAFGGFRAEKGSVFLVCMADLQRRPELYEAAEEFRPERWRTPTWPTYAYLPFGAGTRRCIGERFAWLEGVFFLACLLQRWRFELAEGEKPDTNPKLTLNPRRPIRLRVTAR